MLIGIDASRALRTRRTGTERYAQQIIEHLLRLPDAAEHDWRLYVDGELPPGFFRAGERVTVRHLPARRAWSHRALGDEVTRHSPDVLFVPAHVLPLRRALPPSVVTVHDVGHRRVPQGHTLAQRLYLDVTYRWQVRRAARLIAPSRSTADDLSRFYGASPERTAVVHEAVHPQNRPSRDETAAVLTRHGLTQPYALYVGTLQPRKNLLRLLHAQRLLHNRGIDWPLVLAGGRGWRSEPIVGAAQSLKAADAVRTLGYVDEAELPALLAGARLFAFPSLHEGFGLPVLEAQQIGVPVMTANNSSLPEVAGDAALFVDPLDVEAIADAMLRLSEDEALRQELIAKGHENVKRFSWERAARETLDVLRAAASGKSRG